MKRSVFFATLFFLLLAPLAEAREESAINKTFNKTYKVLRSAFDYVFGAHP